MIEGFIMLHDSCDRRPNGYKNDDVFSLTMRNTIKAADLYLSML